MPLSVCAPELALQLALPVTAVRHAAASLYHACGQAYDIPAFHFDLHLCRTNRPPHTAVRGPGEIQAAMLAEHLLEHVAARLGADPAIIRERNFLRVPGALPAPCSTLKPYLMLNTLNP